VFEGFTKEARRVVTGAVDEGRDAETLESGPIIY
jgi:hypothetical protein